MRTPFPDGLRFDRQKADPCKFCGGNSVFQELPPQNIMGFILLKHHGNPKVLQLPAILKAVLCVQRKAADRLRDYHFFYSFHSFSTPSRTIYNEKGVHSKFILACSLFLFPFLLNSGREFPCRSKLQFIWRIFHCSHKIYCKIKCNR